MACSAPERSSWPLADRRQPLPADGEVALPLGVAGVGGGEAVADLLAFGEGLEGGGEVALGRADVAELVPADGEVALPLGVAWGRRRRETERSKSVAHARRRGRPAVDAAERQAACRRPGPSASRRRDPVGRRPVGGPRQDGLDVGELGARAQRRDAVGGTCAEIGQGVGQRPRSGPPGRRRRARPAAARPHARGPAPACAGGRRSGRTSPVWARAVAAAAPSPGMMRRQVGAGEAVRQAAEDGEQAAAGVGHARAGEGQGDRDGEVEILAAALAAAEEGAASPRPSGAARWRRRARSAARWATSSMASGRPSRRASRVGRSGSAAIAVAGDGEEQRAGGVLGQRLDQDRAASRRGRAARSRAATRPGGRRAARPAARRPARRRGGRPPRGSRHCRAPEASAPARRAAATAAAGWRAGLEAERARPRRRRCRSRRGRPPGGRTGGARRSGRRWRGSCRAAMVSLLLPMPPGPSTTIGCGAVVEDPGAQLVEIGAAGRRSGRAAGGRRAGRRRPASGRLPVARGDGPCDVPRPCRARPRRLRDRAQARCCCRSQRAERLEIVLLVLRQHLMGGQRQGAEVDPVAVDRRPGRRVPLSLALDRADQLVDRAEVRADEMLGDQDDDDRRSLQLAADARVPLLARLDLRGRRTPAAGRC